MENTTLIAILVGVSITMTLIFLYKGIFEKKVQAQENIEDLLSNDSKKRMSPVQNQNIEKLLKKRKPRKDKTTKPSFTDNLDNDLDRANMPISTTEFILIALGISVIGFLSGLFILGLNIVIALLVGIVSFFAPFLFLKLKVMLRLKKAIAQFADVLDSMVNGFKTGYGFSRAIQMIAENYDDPWGTEFGKMAAEMNLGLTQEEALLNLSDRVPSPDVDLFVTGIMIQKETGGNMTELLSNLSKTCRDRFKLFQKVGAISAQGKLSAGIICCVPFGMFALMWLFLTEPTIKFVTNPIGITLLSVVGFWMAIGIVVLYNIVQIEV